MLAEPLESAIKAAVERSLAPAPITAVSTADGQDFDGNDVLYVKINLPGDVGRLPGEHILRAMGAVSEILLQAGDKREPFFKTIREGEEAPEGEDMDLYD